MFVGLCGTFVSGCFICMFGCSCFWVICKLADFLVLCVGFAVDFGVIFIWICEQLVGCHSLGFVYHWIVLLIWAVALCACGLATRICMNWFWVLIEFPNSQFSDVLMFGLFCSYFVGLLLFGCLVGLLCFVVCL